MEEQTSMVRKHPTTRSQPLVSESVVDWMLIKCNRVTVEHWPGDFIPPLEKPLSLLEKKTAELGVY